MCQAAGSVVVRRIPRLRGPLVLEKLAVNKTRKRPRQESETIQNVGSLRIMR